jgi:Protein of unknown function (DUF3431)
MSYKIVVARYHENVDWITDDNKIIYNKGYKLNVNNEILVKNIGRESETYLRYIIENYHDLPDVVVFTQGYIKDHCDRNNIKMDSMTYLLKLKEEAFTHGKSLVPHNHIHHQTKFNRNPFWSPDWNKQNNNYYLHNNYLNNNQKTFIDWFQENIDKNYPNPISIYWNGLFSIRKDVILKRDIEYYKNLLSQVNHHVNPAEGHFLERSWYYIFNH